MAYFNVVCVIAGTGTLGLPYALAQGGWIGILILCLAWWMSTVSLNDQSSLFNAFLLTMIHYYSIPVSSSSSVYTALKDAHA